MKFLYVEDDVALRKSILRPLRSAFPDDQFIEADSFKKAVRLYASDPEICILSDFLYSGANDDDKPNKLGAGGVDLFAHVFEEGTPFAFLSSTPFNNIQKILAARDPRFFISADLVVAKNNIEALPTLIEKLKAMAAKRPGFKGPALNDKSASYKS